MRVRTAVACRWDQRADRTHQAQLSYALWNSTGRCPG